MTARGQENRPSLNRLGSTFTQQNGRLTVGAMSSGSVSSRLGLRAGDQIVSINGKPVSTRDGLNSALLQATSSGSRDRNLQVVVFRDGFRRTIFWPWAALTLAGYVPWWWGPNSYGYYGPSYDGYGYAQNGYGYAQDGYVQSAFLGVILDTRFPNAAVIRRVYADSPAEMAGLRPGDTIASINGQAVYSPQDLTNIVTQMQPGDGVRIQIAGPQPRTVETTLATRG